MAEMELRVSTVFDGSNLPNVASAFDGRNDGRVVESWVVGLRSRFHDKSLFFLRLRGDDVFCSFRLNISRVVESWVVGLVKAASADTAGVSCTTTVLIANIVVTALVPVAAITASISVAADVNTGGTRVVALNATIVGALTVSNIAGVAPVVSTRVA